jgi:hypothetical protein
MTDDELVERWDDYVESMGSVMGDVEHMAQQMRDRIEVLTAERDRAYASGYSDAETEISRSALGQRNAFLHSQYANAADHIKVLTADNARLRAAMIALHKQALMLRGEQSYREFARAIEKQARSALTGKVEP